MLAPDHLSNTEAPHGLSRDVQLAVRLLVGHLHRVAQRRVEGDGDALGHDSSREGNRADVELHRLVLHIAVQLRDALRLLQEHEAVVLDHCCGGGK